MSLASRISAVMLLGWALAAQAQTDLVTVNAAQIRSLGIQTAKPQSVSSSGGIALPAQVVIPTQHVQVISAPLAGLIERIDVSTNETVRRGQRLLVLQSPELAGLERDYLQASLQAQLANQSLKRDEALYREGIIAQSRYQQTASTAAIAAAALSERRQMLHLAGLDNGAIARLQRSRKIASTLEVTAPFAGAVLEINASIGQRTDMTTPLLKLADLSPLWLEIQLPAHQSQNVQIGSLVRIGSGKATGKIINIGRSVNPANQTVAVRAEVASGSHNLNPGQYVEVHIDTPAGKTQWLLPPAAIVHQGTRAVVFVRADGGFRPVAVQVTSQSASGSVAEASLNAQDEMVVRGALSIKSIWQGSGKGE